MQLSMTHSKLSQCGTGLHMKRPGFVAGDLYNNKRPWHLQTHSG